MLQYTQAYHVYLGVDAWMPKYLGPEVVHFISSRMGQNAVALFRV